MSPLLMTRRELEADVAPDSPEQRAAMAAIRARWIDQGLFPLPTDCAARMAEIWPSDEQALAADEEADRLAQEQEDRDQMLRDKRDGEIARYGRNSGE